MARFFVGKVDEFEAQVFNPVSSGTIEYLRNQAERISSGWGDTLTESARQYVSSAQETFDRFYSDNALAAARAAARKVKNLFARDIISSLTKVEEFQAALPRNQRYNMAHVGLRKLYNDQLVDGYSDTYIDHHPGTIGKDHRDWRRLRDGDVLEDEEGDLVRHRYLEMTNETEEPLPIDEKMVIDDNHVWIDFILATTDKDPSNKRGGTR